MRKRKYDVVTAGLQCIDLVVGPVRPGILEREVTTVESSQMLLGGDALNQAITLANLGASVALMGLIGKDRLGNVLLDQLSVYPALDVLNRQGDVSTTISIVVIDENNERHFIYQPSSNLAFAYEHIDEEAVKNASFLSIGGCLSLPSLDGEGMIRLLELAQSAGTRTALDFRVSDFRPDEATLKEMLSRADYVLPSEQEAEFLTGEKESPEIMVQRLRLLGAGNCVIKLGERGCYIDADGYSGYIPAYPCRCIDTTGAGDNFAGAFLYAKTRGWDIIKCARFANAAGSIAVENIGANGAIRSEAQLLERMG